MFWKGGCILNSYDSEHFTVGDTNQPVWYFVSNVEPVITTEAYVPLLLCSAVYSYLFVEVRNKQRNIKTEARFSLYALSLFVFFYISVVLLSPSVFSLTGIAGSNPVGGMDVCLL